MGKKVEKNQLKTANTGLPHESNPEQCAESSSIESIFLKIHLPAISFLFLIISVSLTAQIPYEPPHLELKKAFKDATGNIIVLYREGVTKSNGSTITASGSWRINIPSVNADYQIASDSVHYNTDAELTRFTIAGIGFSTNHPDSFYYGGYETGLNAKAFIRWNGHERTYPGSNITFFEVSPITPGKFTVVMNDTVKISSDYGKTFQNIGAGYTVLGVNPAADGGIIAEKDGILYKSVNAAQFFQAVVQPPGKPAGDLVFSSNGQQLFRSYYTGGSTFRSKIFGSDQAGNPFSWQDSGELQMMSSAGAEKTPDNMFYYSDGEQIYKGSGIGGPGGSGIISLHRVVRKILNFAGSFDLIASSNNSLILRSGASGQDLRYITPGSEIGKFYPLAIGNKFFYTKYSFTTGPEGVNAVQSESVYTIIGDTIDAQYGRFFKWDRDPLGGYQFQQYDSVKGAVYIYNPQGGIHGFRHMLKHDIISREGDLELQYHFSINPYFTFNTANFYSSKFGKTVGIKKYENDGYLYKRFVLTEGFGLDSVFVQTDSDSSLYVLTGAVIDGVVYGDTTLTSVEDAGTLPAEFRLLGNYPNPFNGSTVISFLMPESSDLRMEIFDITGRKIRTTEFGILPAGLNRIDINLNNEVSGVYFYRLISGAGNRSLTGKLLLMK